VIKWLFPKLERYAPLVAQRFFIRIFFTPLNYAVPEKEKAIREKADKFLIRVGGRKIQCYRWGSGPMIVVVHGWAGRASQFRKFIPALEQSGYSVCGFDGPAHGESDGLSTNLMQFREVLQALWDLNGVPEAVIGHSFGGSAALFAAMNGLPVPKLINIASPSIGDEIIQTYLTTIGGTWTTGNYFKSWIIKRTGKTFDEFTAMHFVRNLKAEVALMLVHDVDDQEVSISQARALKDVYPGTILLETSGLGHTRILKDPDVIGKCVTFIRDGRL
jgi:esterase/lipase